MHNQENKFRGGEGEFGAHWAHINYWRLKGKWQSWSATTKPPKGAYLYHIYKEREREMEIYTVSSFCMQCAFSCNYATSALHHGACNTDSRYWLKHRSYLHRT